MCFHKNNKQINNKKKSKYLDKLFIRIFFSSILILITTLIGNKIDIKSKINKNFNFLSLSMILNSTFGNFINIEDQTVYNSNVFDSVEYNQNINIIQNNNFNGIYSLTSGIITKIIKNRKDGLYDITILSSDNFEYTYYGIKDFDLSLYHYVTQETIIGTAKEVNGIYQFNLSIYKDGKYYNFYELCES